MLKSAFKIIVKSYDMNYRQPWKHGDSLTATGSGFAVEISIAGRNRRFIMTNWHVAREGTFIQIMKPNSDKLYEARLFNSAPEVDMALLEIDSKDEREFWDSVTIFPLGKVPMKGEPIHVVGFPLGGDNPSITRGIVSRINVSTYAKAINNLALQIDAAVNHGNSGGPAFDGVGKRIVGIAFAGMKNSEAINFIIPVFTIRHYLERISKHNKFVGVCDLMIKFNIIQNQLMQKELLGEDRGVIITNVAPVGSCGLILQKHDIMTSIDDIPISNDGTIIVDDQYEPSKNVKTMYEKVPYWHYIRMKHPGESVEITVLRDGKKQVKKCTLHIIDWLVQRIDDRISTEHFVLGGFVFLPLNYWHVFGPFTTPDDVVSKRNLIPYIHDVEKEFDDQQIIIVSETVPNVTTTGYNVINFRLHTVNGTEVKNLKHLQQLCENTIGVAKFEFDYNALVLIDMNVARKNTAVVNEHLGVGS